MKLDKLKLDEYILTQDDAIGTKYICSICKNFSPNRLNVHVKGWGKSQILKKQVREHVLKEHKEVL